LNRYLDYCRLVHLIEYERLIFCDEVHFCCKELECRYVIAPVNKRAYSTATNGLNETYDMTALTTVRPGADRPFVYQLLKGTNTQYSFFNFIQNSVANGHIGENMVLILDNASIHKARDTRDQLIALAQTHGFVIRYLPTYSPEVSFILITFHSISNLYSVKPD
jgi:hypothetical protein